MAEQETFAAELQQSTAALVAAALVVRDQVDTMDLVSRRQNGNMVAQARNIAAMTLHLQGMADHLAGDMPSAPGGAVTGSESGEASEIDPSLQAVFASYGPAARNMANFLFGNRPNMYHPWELHGLVGGNNSGSKAQTVKRSRERIESDFPGSLGTNGRQRGALKVGWVGDPEKDAQTAREILAGRRTRTPKQRTERRDQAVSPSPAAPRPVPQAKPKDTGRQQLPPAPAPAVQTTAPLQSVERRKQETFDDNGIWAKVDASFEKTATGRTDLGESGYSLIVNGDVVRLYEGERSTPLKTLAALAVGAVAAHSGRLRFDVLRSVLSERLMEPVSVKMLIDSLQEIKAAAINGWSDGSVEDEGENWRFLNLDLSKNAQRVA